MSPTTPPTYAKWQTTSTGRRGWWWWTTGRDGVIRGMHYEWSLIPQSGSSTARWRCSSAPPTPTPWWPNMVVCGMDMVRLRVWVMVRQQQTRMIGSLIQMYKRLQHHHQRGAGTEQHTHTHAHVSCATHSVIVLTL